MKRHNIFLSLSLVIFLMGCEKTIDVTSIDDLNAPEPTAQSVLDPATKQILEAAYTHTPIDKSNGYIYGVLDRGRTDTRAYVAYSNKEVYEEYIFEKAGSEWKMGEKVTSKKIHHPGGGDNTLMSAQSTTQYTKKIANIYTGSSFNVLLDEWYVPQEHQEEGVHTYKSPYYADPNTATYVEFLEGTQVAGNNVHEIEWVGPWEYARLSSPSLVGSSNNKNTYTYVMDGNFTIWGSHIVDATYRHTITSIDAPSTPALQSPADGFNATSNFISFTWSESSGGGTMTYRLQISENINFSSTFFDESGISNTSKSVGNFSQGVQYYWRVRATNEAGNSNWSTVRSFTAMLLAPSVSGTIQSGNPRLDWSSVQNADYYEIYKRTDTSNWLLYATTSSTSYVDQMADVTGHQGDFPTQTPYVGYYVVARANNGAKSSDSNANYYDLDGFTPHSGDPEM